MTKLLLAIAAMGMGWNLAAGAEESFPSHTLDDGIVKLSMYLPDSQDGFYRSTRFDWSGMISRVAYRNHVFYAYWKPTHDPVQGTDDVVGPAEEFGMNTLPLGYADAKPGETFIKIGVGHVQKIQEPKYRYGFAYKVIRPGEWKITKGDGFVEFQQDLADERGYGYQYLKRISLLNGAPGFIIFHRLKNTGTKALETDYYCHNFTMIDDEKIGPNYRVTLGFDATINRTERPTLPAGVLKVEGKELLFTANVAKDRALWARLDGFKTAADNIVVIRNTKSGAAMKITGDRAPTRWCVYAADTAICPEPFLQFDLAPGGEAEWQNRYELIVDSTAP